MSLARGVAITAMGNLVPPVAALATQPILAHSLGVDGRGEVAAATAPMFLGVVVLGLGIPESLTFFLARRAQRFKRIVAWSMGALILSGAAGMALFAALAPVLSAGDRELAQLILIATTALIPALIVAGLRGLTAGRQAWGLIAIERAASAMLRFCSIAILAITGTLSVLSATVAISMTTFAGGFAYLFLLRVAKRAHGAGARTGTEQIPRFHTYAAQVWLGAAAGIVYSRVDQLLITPLSSVYQLGLYAVAASIAEVILLVNTAVREVIFASESESPDDKRSADAARASTVVTFALGTFAGVFAPWAIPAVFGEAFRDSVLVTLVLILATVLGNPGSVAGAVLSGRGRPGLRSLSLAIGLVVNLIAVFALVPTMGAVGAAIATLIASVLAGNNLNILWLRVFYGVKMRNYFMIRLDDFRIVLRIGPRILRRRI